MLTRIKKGVESRMAFFPRCGTVCKTLLLILLMVILAGTDGITGPTVRVKGIIKKDGTYIAPHNRTSPDKSRLNNWSTKGNINTYTGKKGTADPFKTTYTTKSRKR